MKNLRWMVCLGTLALAACGVESSEQEAVPAESVTASLPLDSQPRSALTCTETFGECRVGPCELGPRDHFQIVTETCCTAAGSCTTRRYRLCGC
jgi:hypothetical protein